MGVTPKCKESTYWKNKEGKGGVWGLRSRILLSPRPFRWLKFNQYLYNTIKAGKEVWTLARRKFFINVLLTALENVPSQAYTGMSEEPFGSGVVRLSLPKFIWLVSCSIVTVHYSYQYLKAMFF